MQRIKCLLGWHDRVPHWVWQDDHAIEAGIICRICLKELVWHE